VSFSFISQRAGIPGGMMSMALASMFAFQVCWPTDVNGHHWIRSIPNLYDTGSIGLEDHTEHIRMCS